MAGKQLKVGIFGHSMVKRLRKAMVSWNKGRHGGSDLYSAAPAYFNLDKLYSRMVIEMEKTYMVRDLTKQLNILTTESVDVCLLISGSNNLVNHKEQPEQIAEELFSLTDYLVHGFGVKLVVFVGAIRRSKCKGMDPEIFDGKVNRFNKRLAVLCTQDAHAFYYSPRGF